MSSWLKAPVFWVSSSVCFPGTIIFRFSSTVGENLKYLVFDREHNPLACLLFGSAAWKCAPLDDFIGWDVKIRKDNLKFLTNNMQFLILPWFRVVHLASHILGRVVRRISSGWLEKYGHPIYLLSNLCGTGLLPGHLLPDCQLDLCRSNQRSQPQRPLCHP